MPMPGLGSPATTRLATTTASSVIHCSAIAAYGSASLHPAHWPPTLNRGFSLHMPLASCLPLPHKPRNSPPLSGFLSPSSPGQLELHARPLFLSIPSTLSSPSFPRFCFRFHLRHILTSPPTVAAAPPQSANAVSSVAATVKSNASPYRTSPPRAAAATLAPSPCLSLPKETEPSAPAI
jgi:hypothetical protein